MDYEKEFGTLNKGSNTFKPETGINELVIMSEPEETTFEDNDGKITEQIVMEVSLSDDTDNQRWFVGKGKTTVSAYGQLMAIGKSKGKLLGEKIQLIVIESKDKDGNIKRTYTIPEAIKYIAQLEKEDAAKIQNTQPTQGEIKVTEEKLV